jgi:SAM-dependent methyltransferase
MSDGELERARREYCARDAATSPYRWSSPGYVSYMQALERALLAVLRDAHVRLEGARVLDVGSGSGYFLHRLREYGAGRCVGIDLLESRVADARERYPGLELVVGSATELPFEEGSFDLVTQFTCLSSIVDSDARMRAAREIRRVAGSGRLLSFDTRRASAHGAATTTVALTRAELERLFGHPELLRRPRLSFPLAELAGRHDLAMRAAAALLPPLRTHYLGLWRGGSER